MASRASASAPVGGGVVVAHAPSRTLAASIAAACHLHRCDSNVFVQFMLVLPVAWELRNLPCAHRVPQTGVCGLFAGPHSRYLPAPGREVDKPVKPVMDFFASVCAGVHDSPCGSDTVQTVVQHHPSPCPSAVSPSADGIFVLSGLVVHTLETGALTMASFVRQRTDSRAVRSGSCAQAIRRDRLPCCSPCRNSGRCKKAFH